jgi:hypothetical protein
MAMGLFNKLNQAFGGADSELLKTGTLGLGLVGSVVPSGGTVQVGGGLVERTCDFQIRVLLNGQLPYFAAVRQRVPEVYIPQLGSGAASVAVRVDPTNPQHIVLDLKTEPPVVRLGQSTGPGSASWLMENGREGTAVIVASQPLGYQSYLGYTMYAFTWTVITGAPQPYQTQSASAVPPEALPLLYPGSKVYVKLGDQPQEVIGDFAKGPVA